MFMEWRRPVALPLMTPLLLQLPLLLLAPALPLGSKLLLLLLLPAPVRNIVPAIMLLLLPLPPPVHLHTGLSRHTAELALPMRHSVRDAWPPLSPPFWTPIPAACQVLPLPPPPPPHPPLLAQVRYRGTRWGSRY